ncbi:leukocyte cell-derived chemotaxin-2-like [Scyliorhinus canicula]|uniref:leukocyte cell-derived chemotaxin-2-like n=1 Tax=Scyliorhinus canicula TaxID=7830 RepID=UPI0018F2C035|nr:leukocyte cell-derived chemotaxin-2-like [Scyliorhinus canicula]
MLRGIVLFILFTQVTGRRWGSLCAGNPTNRVRGSDTWGSGAYGAPRGSRTHKGVDVVCSDGSDVYAPFDGTLVRRANPYSRSNAINNGVMLRGSGYCVKIFYIQPQSYSGNVAKGETIGQLLRMQSVYPGITSHVHIQMCDTSVDPTPNL